MNTDQVRVWIRANKSTKIKCKVFFCAACCEAAYKAGKFHPPVYVQKIDLEHINAHCGICGEPIIKKEGTK